MNNFLELSGLPHTWIVDLDGTIVKHNGHKTLSGDVFLPGALEFLSSIPIQDTIIILTARKEEDKDKTINFLRKNNVRYNHIIFNIPTGERILLNDSKPSGLVCAYSLPVQRDCGFATDVFKINDKL